MKQGRKESEKRNGSAGSTQMGRKLYRPEDREQNPEGGRRGQEARSGEQGAGSRKRGAGSREQVAGSVEPGAGSREQIQRAGSSLN